MGTLLTSLTFKNDIKLQNTITVKSNIGTIGGTGKDITISGGTTGFVISGASTTIDNFSSKGFTVSGAATGNAFGVQNAGTIKNFKTSGAFTVKGDNGSATGIENTGTFGETIIGGDFKVTQTSEKKGNTLGIGNHSGATIGVMGDITINGSFEVTAGSGSGTVVGIGNAGTIGAIMIGSTATDHTISYGSGANNKGFAQGITNTKTIKSIKVTAKNITVGSGGTASGSAVFFDNDGTVGDVTFTASGSITLEGGAGGATSKATLITQSEKNAMGAVSITAHKINLNSGGGSGASTLIDVEGNTKSITINAETMVIGKSDNKVASTLIKNVGTIENDITIKGGKITLDGKNKTTSGGVVLQNSGGMTDDKMAKILGTVTLDAEITATSGSGSAIINEGYINKVVNKGIITAAQISGGTIQAFVNEGTISGASVFGGGITVKDFENKGSIVLDDELKINAFTKDIEGSTVTINTFTNEGTIINNKAGDKNLINFVAKDETKTLDVINKGYLENSGGNTNAVFAASGEGVTLNVYNYGTITAKSGSTFSGGNVNIKHWDIKATTNDFSNQGFTYSGSTVNIDDKALVIEPQKGFKFGEYVKIENMVKEGSTDKTPGLDKFSTTDDIFVISGAKGTDGKDGLIINVDSSRSAAAAATQSSVNASVTRSAFVGNVVGSAVNTAITNFGGINRVSYNDDDVDFSKLEKYARVGSDITDQTYANNSHVFVMPYYTKTSVEVARGGDLNGNTYGLIGGLQKKIGDSSVLGFFIGSEKAKSDATNLDIDDTTWYSGINLYKTLGGTSELDYFAKGMLRTAFTSSDITNAGAKAKSNTNSYGLEAAVGINIYAANHTLTPELGLSYDKVSIDGFMMRGNTYEDNNLNLFVGKLGLNWLAQWTNQVSTNLGTGVRLNFKDDFEQGVIVNDQLFKSKTDLEKAYYYVNLGLTYSITNAWDLSFIYNGDFSSNTSANSGFVKLGYWW